MTKEIHNLREAVLATIAYFSLFNYPLTPFEVWRYLFWPGGSKVELEDVVKELGDLKEQGVLQEKDGMYFEPGKSGTVQERLTRHAKNIEYWKDAQKVFSSLLQIPYVRGLALCNLFALNNLKNTSDIDVFVITEKGHIWSTRLLVTFFVWIKGRWRHQHKIEHRYDLSFYVTRDHLSLEPILRKPYDIYMVYWVATLAFIYDEVKDEFFEANQWVKDFLPNFEPRQEIKMHRAYAPFYLRVARFEERLWEKAFGKGREAVAKKIQTRKMKATEEHRTESSTGVQITDDVLKFHEHDRRDWYRKKFESKFEELE